MIVVTTIFFLVARRRGAEEAASKTESDSEEGPFDSETSLANKMNNIYARPPRTVPSAKSHSPVVANSHQTHHFDRYYSSTVSAHSWYCLGSIAGIYLGKGSPSSAALLLCVS
jgi:hypothetical protein